MYAGHFAAALAIKAAVPRAPTWALCTGVGVCDLLFGGLVLAGIERVAITPGVAPGFALLDIAWSHSLVTSLFWSGLFALAFFRRGAAVMLAIALSVFSHFLLDLVMHPGDLTLWPGSTAHLGLGLWRSLPTGWWWVELGFVAAGCALYLSRARRLAHARKDPSFGGRAAWVCAVVLALHAANSPWTSPTR